MARAAGAEARQVDEVKDNALDVSVRLLEQFRRIPRYPSVPFQAIPLEPYGRHPAYLAFSPENRIAYVVNQDTNNLVCIDVRTKEIVRIISLENADEPWDIVVNPSGQNLYVTNTNFLKNRRQNDLSPSFVTVVDAASGATVGVIPCGVGSNGIALSPGGTRAYVANTRGHTVSVLDLERNEQIREVQVGRSPLGLCCTPDGKAVVVACYEDSTVAIVDVGSYAVELAHGYPSYDIRLDLTADEKCGPPMGFVQVAPHPFKPEVYATHYSGGGLWVLDMETRTFRARLPVPTLPYGLVVTYDGLFALVTHDAMRYITVVELETEAVMGTYTFDRDGDPRSDLLPACLDRTGTEVWIADGRCHEVAVIRMIDLVGMRG